MKLKYTDWQREVCLSLLGWSCCCCYSKHISSFYYCYYFVLSSLQAYRWWNLYLFFSVGSYPISFLHSIQLWKCILFIVPLHIGYTNIFIFIFIYTVLAQQSPTTCDWNSKWVSSTSFFVYLLSTILKVLHMRAAANKWWYL